jgi:tRNA G10  N-methylase Trm11
MSDSICILGRQPAIGIAELESIFTADQIQSVAPGAVLVHREAKAIPLARLGGTVKVAKLLTYIDTTNVDELFRHIIASLPSHLGYVPDGKLQFGISLYNLNASTMHINRGALSIKKIIKAAGRSVRIIPNKTPALSSAQVIHNHLTEPLGMELLLIGMGSKTVLAQTMGVQDIAAYAARDQARPKRDARVGMLPPKLAQTIVNLANPQPGDTVLDCFCGTGVVLQEALLMGMDVYGTDVEQRMVEYTIENIDRWLRSQWEVHGTSVVEPGDATAHRWQTQPFQVVASETYLGRPFSSPPEQAVLEKVIKDVNTIHKKFLINLSKQIGTGFRLCLAVPAWKTSNGFKHLPILDQLTDMGYTRMSFTHVKNDDLIYYREGQIVARELVVLIRK